MDYDVALVTGASSGIGREIARELANPSTRRTPRARTIVLTARRGERLEALRRELTEAQGEADPTFDPTDCRVVAADLATTEGRRRIAEFLTSNGLTVDLLVNNAGIGGWGRFDHQERDRISAMLEVNVVAATELARLLLPDMVAKGHGGILNIASVAAFQPGPFTALYYATKSFLLCLSEGLSEELSGSGVRVCAYCPGPVATEFMAAGGLSRESSERDLRSYAGPNAVASAALRALATGRRVAIHGFRYKAMVFLERFLPRRVIAWAIGLFQRARLA